MASLDGISGTVFVYGQTGTGKTYTMMGHQRTQKEGVFHGAIVSTPVIDNNGELVSARTRNLYETFENSGVLIFAMQDLFTKINDIQIS
jgi:AAA+ superfamily predicted ATPase